MVFISSVSRIDSGGVGDGLDDGGVGLRIRRAVRFVRGLLRYSLIGLATCGGAADATDWPRFLGSTQDGVSATDDTTIDWTAPPVPQWSLEVGEGYGLGCIHGERYFHFDGVIDRRAGALHQRLRCVAMSDGRELWSRQSPIIYRDLYGYERGPRSGPTVDGEFVYVHGVSGLLECRRADSGERIWSVDTGEAFHVVQNFFGVGGAPLVVDDLVLVMVGGSPESDLRIAPGRLDRVSPNGSVLVAYDKRTGERRWACGDDLASYSSPRTIDLDGRRYVLLFARERLWLVDPAKGVVQWSHKHRADLLESVNAMVPLVEGNHVLISECYDLGSVLLRVTPSSARVAWQDPPGDRRRQSLRSHWSGPTFYDGALFGCSGRNAPDSDFRCVDFKTGRVLWSDMARRRSSVTRVGKTLLVWQERGELHVIAADRSKYRPIAKHDYSASSDSDVRLNYPCWAAPIVVDDRLLLRGDRRVHVFRLPRVSAGPPEPASNAGER